MPSDVKIKWFIPKAKSRKFIDQVWLLYNKHFQQSSFTGIVSRRAVKIIFAVIVGFQLQLLVNPDNASEIQNHLYY